MLNISLVDDDGAFLADLKSRVERHLAEREIESNVCAFPDAESFWEHHRRTPSDLVFLDIMLPGDNGISTARAIHAADKGTAIVFLTSSPEFAMVGYGVNALFYLLKPVDDDKIRQAVEACRKRLSERNRIVVKTETGLVGINVETITHLEIMNRHVRIHAPPAAHMHRGKLSDLAGTLPPGFAQVHKSFYVNLDRVTALMPTRAVLDDGQSVPISRRFRKDAADRFFSRIAPPF
jgi:DNA-binding LytR/AlgR family response regulator